MSDPWLPGYDVGTRFCRDDEREYYRECLHCGRVYCTEGDMPACADEWPNECDAASATAEVTGNACEATPDVARRSREAPLPIPKDQS